MPLRSKKIALYIGAALLSWAPMQQSKASSPAAGRACLSGAIDLLAMEPETVSDYSSDMVLQWLRVQMDIARQMPGFSPPVISRAIGYTGVGLYEALLPAMPGKASLVEQLQHPPRVPPIYSDVSYHWPTVAAAYMRAVTRYFYLPFGVSLQADEEQEMADALWRKQSEILQKEAYDKVYERSVRRGEDLAAVMYVWSLSDGEEEPYVHNFPGNFIPPEGDDKWAPEEEYFAGALHPKWGEKRQFLDYGGECDPPPPPPYSEKPGSEFMKEVEEVRRMDKERTGEQKRIGFFWADEPLRSCTPPGHMLQILADMLEKKHADLAFASESLAKLGVALSDAFVECWRSKYTYMYPRPIVVIQRLLDPDWLPLYPTPPFPEYTSGHSVQTGAATTILASIFGKKINYTDHNRDYLYYKPRTFGSFEEIKHEAAMSRIYGGVHFRSSVENGVTQGECIGRKVLNTLKFDADVTSVSTKEERPAVHKQKRHGHTPPRQRLWGTAP